MADVSNVTAGDEQVRCLLVNPQIAHPQATVQFYPSGSSSLTSLPNNFNQSFLPKLLVGSPPASLFYIGCICELMAYLLEHVFLSGCFWNALK